MADPTYYLDINGLSRHLDTDKELNEKNYGFGVTQEKVLDNRLVRMLSAGGYKNSYDNNSLYATAGLAKRFKPTKNVFVDIGGVAGGATGYTDKIKPIAAANLAVGHKKYGRLNLLYGPETDSNPAVFMMNLGIPIK